RWKDSSVIRKRTYPSERRSPFRSTGETRSSSTGARAPSHASGATSTPSALPGSIAGAEACDDPTRSYDRRARRSPRRFGMSGQARAVTRDVEPSTLHDLLEHPPRATIAFVDREGVDVLPVRARYRADTYRFGVRRD